jgi:CheY-like chemotaxis protein
MDNKRPKIFLVEDNADIREIYRLRFEVSGFDVDVAENGLEAITKVAEVNPNIILLDIMMPEMSGYEVIRTIKQNFSDQKLQNVPIVIWSNLSEESDVQKALDAGATQYLRKSDYDGDDLIEKVQEIFAKYK